MLFELYDCRVVVKMICFRMLYKFPELIELRNVLHSRCELLKIVTKSQLFFNAFISAAVAEPPVIKRNSV